MRRDKVIASWTWPATPQIAAASLVKRFQAYSAWRANVASRIGAYRRWLQENELADAQTELRIASLLERLGEDKLAVAFVAEFSRGKSELINAIFFADYGQRLLPSSSGRTTMCPTELLWDPASRAVDPAAADRDAGDQRDRRASSSASRDEWHVIPLDVGDAQALVEAFQQVRETKRVPIEEAKHYGLFVDHDSSQAAGFAADGMVEIPCWRHAMINFPHPLLEQGLVILDTPGLNAIGTEPELTLNLLPNAHAVLFILAADAGVSKSDVEVWNEYLAAVPGRQKGRYVVVNKIDALWDGLRSEAGDRRRDRRPRWHGSATCWACRRAGARGVGAEGAGREDHRRRDASSLAAACPSSSTRCRRSSSPASRRSCARRRGTRSSTSLSTPARSSKRVSPASSSSSPTSAACAARTSTWSRR